MFTFERWKSCDICGHCKHTVILQSQEDESMLIYICEDCLLEARDALVVENA